MILRLLALLLVALPAFAQDKADVDVTTITLRAQADREVANDQVVAIVAAEESGQDPAGLANAVNRKVAAATALIKAEASVKYRSAGYQTQPVYKSSRIESWRVSHQLRLEGSDFAAMAQLVGRLQGEMLLRQLSVGLAPETRRAAEDALIAEAIASFHARAEIIRRAMKVSGYRVRSLDVGTSGGIVRPLAMEMARSGVSSSIAAPVIEGGVSTVSVSVSGAIGWR
jgi:predicted secreted protein